MKAPKLFLALGLSIPVLVQGLTQHQHGHADLANSAEDHLNSLPYEHGTKTKHPKHSKTMGGNIWHLNGTPTPAAELSARDEAGNAADAGKPPPSRSNIIGYPGHPPHGASINERDRDDGDVTDEDKPKKKYCDPLSPLCFDRPPHEGSIQDAHQVPEKRQSYVSPGNAGADTNSDTDSDDDSDDDLAHDLLQGLQQWFEGSEELPQMSNWFTAVMSDWHDKRDEHMDEGDVAGNPLSRPFSCAMLEAACESGQRPCACNLVQRCASDISVLTTPEVNICILGDGPIGNLGVDLKDDRFARCYAAVAACDSNIDCACPLKEQCRGSGSEPSWSALEGCLNSAQQNHHAPTRRNDKPKALDGFIEKESKCEALEEALVDACENYESACACRLSRQCQAIEKGPAPSSIDALECISENQLTADTEAEADRLLLCPTVRDRCKQKRGSCYCGLEAQCRNKLSAVPSWHLYAECADASNDLDPDENLRKRDMYTSATPGYVTTSYYKVFGQPASAIFSVQATSPLVLVEKYYDGVHARTHTQSFLPGMTSPIVKRQAPVETSVVASSTSIVEQDDTSVAAASTSTVIADDPSETSLVASSTSTVVVNDPSETSVAASSASPVDPASATSATTVVVAGDNTTPYFKATDANGMPVYVTRTGEYAASTKTLWFTGPYDSATPGSNTVTKYSTVTETRTVRGGNHFHRHKTPAMADKTVVDFGNTEVPMTAAIQTINGTVISVQPQPSATLMPLTWKAAYARGWEHILGTDEDDVVSMFGDDDIDWDNIRQMSWRLREENGHMVPELSFHKALIMHMRNQGGDPESYPNVTSLDRYNVRQYFGGKTMAVIDHSVYTMNGTTPIVVITPSTLTMSGTQTQTIINGTAVVIDPLGKYQRYDARHHRVAPTPACVAHGVLPNWMHFGNKECRIEKCMWKHMSPLRIQTAFPAAMAEDSCGGQIYDYFTHSTMLNEPHWGTTHSVGLYYPVAWAKAMTTQHYTYNRTVTVEPSPTCTLSRQLPVGFDPRSRNAAGVHLNPSCSDMESCHHQCAKHAWPIDPRLLLALAIGLPLGVILPLAALLFCCCIPMIMKRRRNRPQNQTAGPRKPTIVEKIRRMSTTPSAPQTVVVNAVTGQATDPATGQVVDAAAAGPGTTTAVVTGAAAGAAAAKAAEGGGGDASGSSGANPGAASTAVTDAAGQPTTTVVGDDGKGTLGRQAEEGRSRVHFDEAPKPVPEGETPQVVTEPPKTDGTMDSLSASGREWADVGSMRGRKTKRQGLNLQF